MVKIKRFFALILAGLLLPALAACGGPAGRDAFGDAPDAYRPLLGGILKLVQTAREEDGDWAWISEPGMEDLESQWLGGTDYIAEGNMGYAITDINSDGTPELLWLGKSSENPEEILLYALFTLKDGAPVRLFSRGLRGPGVLARDGTLCCAFQGGMGTTLISCKLEPGAAQLTQVDAYNSVWMNEPGTRVYSRGEAYDEQQAIPQAEFEALQALYLNPPDPMEFTFIPIVK